MIRKITNLGFTLIRTRLSRNLVNVHAFTLIELLVVISIIGILASLLLARFGSVEKNSRDTRRKSDLNQYRTAMENYSIKTNGVYPDSILVNIGNSESSVCGILKTGSFLSICPTDPTETACDPPSDSTQYCYRYESDTDGLNYMLWDKMEMGGFWYICSNGKSVPKASAPVTGDCW